MTVEDTNKPLDSFYFERVSSATVIPRDPYREGPEHVTSAAWGSAQRRDAESGEGWLSSDIRKEMGEHSCAVFESAELTPRRRH